jgi:ribosomal protein S18 acetylase RimI-like enzyme
VIGLAIGDRATDVASIFASDSDVCESLRKELGHSEFFSEVRHPKLASVARLNMTAPNEAYNVYETFEVMALERRPEDLGFDTDLVSPMKDEDRKGAHELLNAVYGVRSDEWLAASLGAGDLAWVAHVDGRVVGLAMATLVGTQGRLHTLTVHKDHQNRGIGTALYRARLRGLFDLGATRIITECATWNVGALELPRAHGFTKIGTMYVESARDSRVERKFVRR